MTKSTSVIIPGPAGSLEGILGEPETTALAIAVIAHPHPLYGGTMKNKVVTTLAKSFQTREIITLCFNFRGIGKSAGFYANGDGEIEDMLAAIAWLKNRYPNLKLYVSGFSFGAYIALSAAQSCAPEKIILVAPPVENFPMENLINLPAPTLLLQGDQDEVVPAEKVYDWANRCEPIPTIVRFPEATHFFHHRLLELQESVVSWLN